METTQDTRTENDLIREALLVQDACNLSGVVHSFSRTMTRLWVIAKESGNYSTYWVNHHRVSRLFTSKIVSLVGEVQFDDFTPMTDK